MREAILKRFSTLKAGCRALGLAYRLVARDRRRGGLRRDTVEYLADRLEAPALHALVDRLKANNVQVYGINPQSAHSHADFRQKQKLPFPLLVDQGQRLAKLYHANGPFVKRTVYLIDIDGKIRLGRRGAPSPDEVLAALR